MTKLTLGLHTDKLNQDGLVIFYEDEVTYEIHKSFSEPDAYVINTYHGDVADELMTGESKLRPDDDGFYTGSAEDAIMFMIPTEDNENKTEEKIRIMHKDGIATEVNPKEMKLIDILSLDGDEYTDGEILEMVFEWEKEDSLRKQGVKIMLHTVENAMRMANETIE